MTAARDPALVPCTLVLTADDALRAAFAKLLQARGHRLEFSAELPAAPCVGVRLAVIGIGLNVRPLDEVDAGSGFACMQEIDARADAPALLHRVALPLAHALRRFEAEGFAAFVADYARRDLLAGHTVRTTQQGVSEGIARGVDASGALQLQTAAGLVAIHSGEVSVRLDVQA